MMMQGMYFLISIILVFTPENVISKHLNDHRNFNEEFVNILINQTNDFRFNINKWIRKAQEAFYENDSISTDDMKKHIQIYSNLETFKILHGRHLKIRTLQENIINYKTDKSWFFQKEVFENIIDSNERDEELQNNYIKEGSDQYSRLIKTINDIFILTDQLADENGYPDKAEFWNEMYGWNKLLSINELQTIWKKELDKPYRLFMSFMRKQYSDLFKTYNGIEDAKGPLPAYVYDMIFQAYRNNVPESFNTIYKRTMEAILDINYKNSSIFNIEFLKFAQTYFESLGFPALSDTFWNKSTFSITNNLIPEIKTFYHGDPDYWIEIKGPVNVITYYEIHYHMYDIYRMLLLEKEKLPIIFWEPDFLPFHEAFKRAVLMPIESLSMLVHLEFRISNTITHELVINWLEGKATRHFTTAASAMVFITWERDVLANKTLFEDMICEYWNRRYHYEGVVPLTVKNKDFNPDKTFDAYTAYYLQGADQTINEFITVILQYQIFASLCQMTGIYRPEAPWNVLLHNCDFRSNYRVGKMIREVMSRGSSVNWRRLLDQIMADKNAPITAKGFLNYFSPIMYEINITREGKRENLLDSISKKLSINFCSK